MSAGFSSGSEDGSMNQSTTSSGTSTTDYERGGLTQIKLAPWAKQLNRRETKDRTLDSGMARDFLTGLLQDPYSGDSSNRFSSAISHLLDYNLARARTGDSAHMGAARQGFREAEAVASAQRDAIGQGISSAVALLSGANPYEGLRLQRDVSPIFTNEQGTSTTQTEGTSNTSGTSSTSGSNVGAGFNLCCFIFLEALNGELPWFVRRCRDEFCSGSRVRGYRRMSMWLVPAMRVWKAVAKLVNFLMVKPLTSYGGWLYGEKGYRFGFLWFPFVVFWFTLWHYYGQKENQ